VDGTLFEQVGGVSFFIELVDAFYDAVEHDEVLQALYPDDLSESRRHLALFLAQYWGGPNTYERERGHPRLRMRHARFAITTTVRDAWLAAMSVALESVRDQLDDAQLEALSTYFVTTATQLRNV